MKNTDSALRILLSLCDSHISHHELNHLIEIVQNYAHTYLKYRYKNLHKTLAADDLTLDELAIDSIAQLFERDDDGNFTKLITAFNNWQPPIETEEKALFFLNRIVAKSVEKYVSEILRESDPFFSKVLDSVNYQVEKQNYKKKQILGTAFIIEGDYIKKIGCLPDSRFINELPSDLFQEMNSVVPKLFHHIKAKTDYEVAIPLNALVSRIKKIRAFNFNFSDKVEFENQMTIDSILNKALNFTVERLHESYSEKGKLSNQETCGIEKAIRSIAIDIKDGGINPGLHKYFLEQFPSLTFNDYEIKYQNIFEYLYKFLKKEIASQIKDGI